MNERLESIVSIDYLTDMLPSCYEQPREFHRMCLEKLAEFAKLDANADKQLRSLRLEMLTYRATSTLKLRRSEDPSNPLMVEVGTTKPTEKSIEAYINATVPARDLQIKIDDHAALRSLLKNQMDLIREYIDFVVGYSPEAPVELDLRDNISTVFDTED